MDFLVSPGTPFYIAAIGAIGISVLGIMRLRAVQTAQIGFNRAAPRPLLMVGRFASGQTLALILAVLLASIGLASGATGNAQLLWFVSAGAAYLYFGMVVPRRPVVEQQKQAVKLRSLTPGFISFMRVSLAGRESPNVIMERYIRRHDERRAPMQAVVSDALVLVRDQRLRVFEALHTVARDRGCTELTSVAQALAMAESEGAPVDSVLVAQQATMEALLQDEFTRMLKRRTLYLLGVTALSLVIGVMGNILFVMVGSTGLIPGIGPGQ